MNEIEYFQATESDVQTMADSRIEFLVDFLGEQTTADSILLKQKLEKYFSHAIKHHEYICWIAKIENNLAGIGGMVIRVQPGNFKNPSGKSGYIMNRYTIPAYRRQGICKALLEKLMKTGREMGITLFELHATKEGEPVYQKSGFQIHSEPTYRKYDFDI